MKVITLSVFFTAVFLTSRADNKCFGTYFNNRYYQYELLKEGLNNARSLVYDKNENTVYFIVDLLYTVPTRVLAYLNIDNRNAGLVDNLRNVTSLTIDRQFNKIYAGTTDGIYRLNDKRVPELLPIRDHIQSVFFKDALFYTNARKQAYIYEDNYINPLWELEGVEAENVILDDDRNIFFTQGNTLFRVKFGTKAVNSHERYKTNFITTDSYFTPYVSTDKGIFSYNKYKYVFDEVSPIKFVKALTFNKRDEPIFVAFDKMIRLEPNTTVCLNVA